MKKIQMVDLISQYKKIKPSVDKAIETVLNNATFINGPEVNEFKTNLQEYLNVKHVIPCANGTDALQIAMMALDLKPGDEVITTNFTFAATVEVIALLTVTVCDTEPLVSATVNSFPQRGLLASVKSEFVANVCGSDEKLETHQLVKS